MNLNKLALICGGYKDILMTTYNTIKTQLLREQHTSCVTGVAGFIGSNLLETLLKLNQTVVGLDNFSTGYQKNLDEVQSKVSLAQWSNFTFIQGDIRNLDDCNQAVQGCDYVLHQAALGSVPRSIEDPILSNAVNVSGQLNMLVAARDANIKGFVYAASSSTYGDLPGLKTRLAAPFRLMLLLSMSMNYMALYSKPLTALNPRACATLMCLGQDKILKGLTLPLSRFGLPQSLLGKRYS